MVAAHAAAVIFSRSPVVGRASAFRPFLARFFAAHSERPESQDENLGQRAKAQLQEAGREGLAAARELGREVRDGVKDDARTAAKVVAGSAPVARFAEISDKIPGVVKETSRSAGEQLNKATDVLEQESELVQDRTRQAASDVQGKARDFAGKVGEQVKGLTGQAQNSAQRAKQSAEKAANKNDNFAKRVAVSLNESIDAAEDKFAASFSPSAGSPQKRQPDMPVYAEVLRAAQAREEANINDLIDELEDKVRHLDHIKDAVKRDVEASRDEGQKESRAC